jgi:putative DNA primase/helicase
MKEQQFGMDAVSDKDSPRDRPIEAIDDPHRLARAYLNNFGSTGGEPTLWFWRGEFYRWKENAYRPVEEIEIRAEITRTVKDEFDGANVMRLREDATKPKGKKQDPVCNKVTTSLVGNVLQAAMSERLLEGEVDQPSWIGEEMPFPANETLATASGLLHLPSLFAGDEALLPPTPQFFSTNAVPYRFEPNADCPEWLKFLDTLWPDDPKSIEVLQEWFGYCLLADTRHHKLLMLLGPPRSGKGTIGRVLRAVIGEQNLASPTLASLAGPFGLWPLVGKLVAMIADARLSGRADGVAVVERLLSISGEDPQNVDRKNLPTLAGIRLPVRFVILTNELPNMRDASGALTTRLILLRLTVSFVGKEDRGLEKRLLNELPGILNWSICGLQRLNARGYFEQPDSGRELLDDLEELASPIGAFIQDRCLVGPEYSIRAADLFAEWRSWCEAHGRDHPGTCESLGKDLRAAVPNLRRTKPRVDGLRVPTYYGVGLR